VAVGDLNRREVVVEGGRRVGRREANDIDHVWYRIVNIGVQNKAY